MKLPDYNKSQLWANLRQKMGADFIREVSSSKYNKIDEEEFRQLSTSGIEVKTLDDIIKPGDGTFEFKGQKILVYIKEQNATYFNSGYRFHLSTCSTISQMRRSNRYNTRYVQTMRADGMFEVILRRSWGPNEEKVIKMDVCLNCLKSLHSKYRDPLFYSRKDFSIDGYFKKFNNEIKTLPLNTVQSYKPNNYTSEWDKISIKMREDNNWICQTCHKNFATRKARLHTHHINGRKDDNRRENLKVVCDVCHSKEPGHGHMKASARKAELEDYKPTHNTLSFDSENQVEQKIPPISNNSISPESLLQELKTEEEKIRKLINYGEGEKVEFKETLKWDIHQKRDNLALTEEILKTVASYMNTDGGAIIVGVRDNGEVKGLEKSLKNTDDALKLVADKFIVHIPGHLFWACTPKIHKVEGKYIMGIYVQKSDEPVYYQPKGKDQHTEFWIRHSARKIQLDPSEIHDYVTKRFKN